jgi:hypothetical protein
MAVAAALALVIAAPVAATAAEPSPASVDWQGRGPAKTYKTAWEHFEALKARAHGGQKKTLTELPDWSGLWERVRRTEGWPYPFDLTEPANGPTTAKLTPEYQAKFDKKMADYRKGVEWDALSYCLPAGMPRWLTEPRPREYIVRPEAVWMSTEQQSEFRRVYTDGRGHIPEDEAFPLWEGDSIGFWDGDVLVVHTNHMKAGQYQRQQPDYSDQVEVVEEIKKVSPTLIEHRTTVYDPPALREPWVTIQKFEKISDLGGALRINMWSCNENNNVVKDDSGTTNFVLPGEPGYKDPSTLGRPPA